MPPKKKASTKSKGQDDTTPQFTIIKTELAPIKGLQVYYKNPRVGDVNSVAKSLHVNGQYKPIVVNLGTHTGRKNEILAGNHTYLAARKELTWTSEEDKEYVKPAWDHMWQSFVDVDEEAAKRIVLADNATADNGTYDEKLRAELLLDLPNIDGLGISFDDFEEMVADFRLSDDDEDDSLDTAFEDLDETEEEATERKKFAKTPLGEEGETEDADGPSFYEKAKAKEQGVEITKQSDELEGAFDLKDDVYYDGVGHFNIPRLRTDMLMQVDDIPDTLKTWAGSASRDEPDPETWWWYNYGIDSTSGMQDISKVIVAFYCYDDYFESWWHTPSRYVAKLLNSGIKYIMTPDFSQDTIHGNAFNMWQLFRMRWLGRYFQEAGLKVIPNVVWPFGKMDFLTEFTLPTLPNELPVISMEIQTYDPKDDPDNNFQKEMQAALDHISPDVLILYTGDPGWEWFQNSIETDGIDVRRLPTRNMLLGDARKKRPKKNTI